MAALDSQRLVAPVIGSWITASPTSLGRFLRIETTDGAYISGMVVRDKSGPDFYAYQSRGKEGTESAQRIALMMVKKLGYAPLTLAFATPNGEVEVNWDGKVAVTSNTSDALDIADAMGRYQTVRDRFVFRWRPVGPTTLQEAGFGADLVNLYLGGNWSHPGINQRLHLETSLQGDALEG